VAVLLLLNTVGATMTHIPYKDGGLNDLIGGQVDASLEVTAMAIPQIQAGRLRPLLVAAHSRLDKLPDVPTLTEAGLGAPLYSWNGLFAPSGTPPDVVARLASVMQDITTRPDFRQKVLDFSQVPRGGTPADFAAFLAKDYEAWGRVVTRNQIKID
jgi:tripartite-type tricarboxylate transporter receptor subunit TctC